MSLFSKIFSLTPLGWSTNALKWIFSGGAKSMGNSLLSGLTGSGLTAAEREANAFTAQQSELARQWQEDMYTKYESPAAMMNQYREAGLNPALMYGDASSGSVGTNASAGSSVSPGSSGLPGLFQLLMSAASLKSEIKLNEANANAANANANASNANAQRTTALTPLEVSELASRIDLNKVNMTRAEAEGAVALANVALLQVDLKYKDQFNELNLALGELNKAKSAAEYREINQRTQNLMRDYVISFAKEAEIKANSSLLEQEALNAAIEAGILSYNEQSAKYESALTEYNYNHADGNRVWSRIATGASAIRDVAVGVGGVAAGLGSGVVKGAVSSVTTSRSSRIYGPDGKLISETVLKH